MLTASIALSRHVGLGAGRRSLAAPPFRREVGFCSIKDGIAAGCLVRKQERQRLRRWNSSTSSPPNPQSSTTSAPPPPPPPPNAKRPFYLTLPTALALTLLAFTTGFTMSGSPAIPSITALANPPTDAETLTLYHPSTPSEAEVETLIQTHPLTQSLLSDARYTASRPHLKIPEPLRPQNLTAGTLLGADKIAVPPLQFVTSDGSSYVSLQYLGPALCGHPGIVHGGLLATMLDEGLARCCFPALPNKVGVTASLKVDYKAPCLAGQVVVLRAETVKAEGRKAWVEGRLETLGEWEGGVCVKEGTVLTRGEALFIEPRQAKQMARVVN